MVLGCSWAGSGLEWGLLRLQWIRAGRGWYLRRSQCGVWLGGEGSAGVRFEMVAGVNSGTGRQDV